jgi:Tannase and feruloyl esterase
LISAGSTRRSAPLRTAPITACCSARSRAIYLSPNTQFTELLPQTTWLGDYLQQGCGGYCGHSEVNLDDPSRTSLHQAPFGPLRRGEFVVAADDQGHEGPGTLWGKEDLILRVVFGYRSERDLSRAAKAIIRSHYGSGPAHAYFDGGLGRWA